MPGFADNLRRLCQDAGISPAEAGGRLGAGPREVDGWLAPGGLPELPVVVRLADALGCRVDDLLAGSDEDFALPERRHAGLIAARMGRVRVLLTQVRLGRFRGEIRPRHEAHLDEASLLATVERCRAWVMSEAHDPHVAARIEAELDRHVARVAEVLADAHGTAKAAASPARLAPTAGRARATVAPASAPSARFVQDPIVAIAAPPTDAPRRSSGHRSTLWAHEHADQQHECVMVTRASEVDVELLVDDRVLETRTCRTLDEALQQSSEWKRTYLAPAILALPELPR